MKYTRIRKIINDNFNEKHKEKIENLEIINSYGDKEFYSYVKSIFKKEGYRRGGEIWVEAVYEGQGVISFGSLKKPLTGDYNWMPEGYRVSIQLNYNAKIGNLSIQADCPKEYTNIKYLKKQDNSSSYVDINKLKKLNENSIIEFKKMLLDHRLPLSNLILVAEDFGLISDGISKSAYRMLVECVAQDRKFYEKINGGPRKNSIESYEILTNANDILENLAPIIYGPTKDYVGSDSLVADLKKVFGNITLKGKPLLAFAGFLSPILVFLNIIVESNFNLNFAVSVWSGVNPAALVSSIFWNFMRVFLVVFVGLTILYQAAYLGSLLRVRYRFVVNFFVCVAGIAFFFSSPFVYEYLYEILISNEFLADNTKNGISNSLAGLMAFAILLPIALIASILFFYKILLHLTYSSRRLIKNSVASLFFLGFILIPGVSPIWNNNSWLNCGYAYYADTDEVCSYKYIVGNMWQEKSQILIFPGSANKWYKDNDVKFPPGSYVVPNEDIENLMSCTGTEMSNSEVMEAIKQKKVQFMYGTKNLETPIADGTIYKFHTITGFSKIDNKSQNYWIKARIK